MDIYVGWKAVTIARNKIRIRKVMMSLGFFLFKEVFLVFCRISFSELAAFGDFKGHFSESTLRGTMVSSTKSTLPHATVTRLGTRRVIDFFIFGPAVP